MTVPARTPERASDLLAQMLAGRITKTRKGCWLWNRIKGRPPTVPLAGHQHALYLTLWTLLHGKVWRGHVLERTCSESGCVNPAHYVRVTRRARSKYARATHCVNGHPFNEENVYRRKGGHRKCRRCAADCEQRRRRAKRAA